MFVVLNQANSGDPVGIDVRNIKCFFPDEREDDKGISRKSTMIELYDNEVGWLVSQSFMDVVEACQAAKRGGVYP